MATKMHPVTPEVLAKSMSYPEFVAMTEELLAAGKTTGENHSEAYLDYTKMTLRRMLRLNKTVEINPELTAALQAIDTEQVWLVLVEAWCGDVGQNVPIIHKMAELNDKIELRLLLRDENPDVINAYLTNGGKGIPKFVAYEKAGMRELGVWGPRPAPAQAMVMAHKADPQEPYSEFVKKVQLWYRDDKTRTIQAEFLKLLELWK